MTRCKPQWSKLTGIESLLREDQTVIAQHEYIGVREGRQSLFDLRRDIFVFLHSSRFLILREGPAVLPRLPAALRSVPTELGRSGQF